MKKINLFMSTAIAIAAVSTVTAPLQTEAATKNFSDVSPKNDYYHIIKEMVAKEVITGYPDGTFKPNELMTRKHAAALISRAFPTLPAYHKGISLTDVNKDNPYYKDIRRVLEADIIQHANNFDFRPNDIITRGEMARAIALAYKLSSNEQKSPLTDVSPQLASYVDALYANDITTGFEDKTFREDKGLTRVHFAVFMYRAEQAIQNNKVVTAYNASKFHNMKETDIQYPTKYKNAAEATEASISSVETLLSKSDEMTSITLQNEKEYNAFIESAQIMLNKSAQQLDDIIYKVYSTGIAESIPSQNNQLWVLWYDYSEKKLFKAIIKEK
ncbi:S-layer homology domain-containing protein [Metasolibacillus meyeri]|uniref:S-layer homology domain-containing protein n=1 Tax=Metasolibacillus meyeri TaxID=1071052 RepID=A0AAW9NMR4_9BACL|nr:S-layer homology domain-containing protein [Metasolibacillus meyeri]MEC1177074.1 S-layer homology domain-containing protein [Metasolibacillus meyeri]